MARSSIKRIRFGWRISIPVIVAIIAAILHGSKQPAAEHWLIIIATMALLIPMLLESYRETQDGRWGNGLLPIAAIITALIVHQYWTALIVLLVQAIVTTIWRSTMRKLQQKTALPAARFAPVQVLRGRKLVETPVAKLAAGDKFILEARDTVPVDGTIVSGQATLHIEQFGGAVLQHEATPGSVAWSGSTVLNGSVTVRAVHTAANSHYQRLTRLITGARSTTSPFIRTADKFILPYTLAAFGIAIAAWILGHSSIRFLDVLAASSTIPLLAATVSLTAALKRAARSGIIVRSGRAFEQLASAGTVAFGLHNTLTGGHAVLQHIDAAKPYHKADILTYAASLEATSDHPFAAAITEAARAEGLRVTAARHVTVIEGRGLVATVGGRQVLLGSAALMADNTVDIPDRSAKPDSYLLYLAVDGRLAGSLELQDKLRDEAAACVRTWTANGAQSLLLTGNSTATAQAVAGALAISSVEAGASPADKLRILETGAAQPTIFIGDSIDDTPLLTVADVGIMLNDHAAAAALEPAAVIILGNRLSATAYALRLARRFMTVARAIFIAGALGCIALMAIWGTGRFPAWLGAIVQGVLGLLCIFLSVQLAAGRDKHAV